MTMAASLLIVGAGPAGLMAALVAASRNPPHGVTVVERLPAAGVKLAASGGGRGNLSHIATEDEFVAAFGKHGRFTLPAFRALPPEALQRLLKDIGVPTLVDDTGRVYPRSQSAAAVRDALFHACRKAGVRFQFGQQVQSLTVPATPEEQWRVDSWTAHSVLLAAGGQSTPRLGSDGSGFALARSLGYSIIPPVPALTSIQTMETWPGILRGVSLPDATLAIADSRGSAVRGELLFTHRGLSGPAVLNLSGRIARLRYDGHPVILRLSVMPDLPSFARQRTIAGTRRILSWLSESLPRSLATVLLELSGIPRDLTFSRLAMGQERALLLHLTACPLTVSSTGGFEQSMATAGGITLKQVCPETLAGRLTPRLFLAGEILDLDGPTGGWNLHWAFCSGYLAGMKAGF
jgi:predicted Rossmann fold flavoprotein